MSVYRSWQYADYEIAEDATAQRRPQVTSTAIAPSPPVHLRRSQPAQSLLPETSQWIASLPPGARPCALSARFPRIANQLAAQWNDPVALNIYFRALLNVSPRRRQGFPIEIMRELQVLDHLHVTRASRETSRGAVDPEARPLVTIDE